jgi:hypothetical protein
MEPRPEHHAFESRCSVIPFAFKGSRSMERRTRGRWTNAALEPLQRLTAEAMGAFEQDLANIKAGAYKLPWDMTTIGHQQYNPFFIARQSARYISAAVQVLGDRSEQNRGKLPFGKSLLYPEYYQVRVSGGLVHT